jgi:hypothetical protein
MSAAASLDSDAARIDSKLRPPLTRWVGRFFTSWMLLAGAGFLLTSLATIATFAWPQPAFDQYRLYPLYLELPFPENILQRENGHRPIVPGLVRVAEIRWFAANQQLQIGVGLAAAILTALLAAWICLRDKSLTQTARATGAAAAVIAVFWLGNARMLLHGNELVHAYLLTLCVVAGTACVFAASRTRPMLWMLIASLAATIATFCFGPGIACFPAFAIAAWAAGVRTRACAVPVFAMVASLILYLGVLPEDGSVRDSLTLRPIENIVMAARWIASPWINGWLGFAEPALIPHHANILAAGRFAWIVSSANWVIATLGLPWSTWGAGLIGAAGFAVLAAWLLRTCIKRDVSSPADLLGGVLMMFGAASSLIISLGRLPYLQENPVQIFADRYLVWPCLFWLGVLLVLLAQRGRMGSALRRASIVIAAVFVAVLLPTHHLGAGWGATVYRANQQTAAAARADVLSAEVLWRDDPSASFESKLHSLALFRQRNLAMFAPAGAASLGQRWRGTLSAAPSPQVQAIERVPVSDHRPGRAVAAYSGVLWPDAPTLESNELLIVLDDGNDIVGFGEPSSLGSGESALRWTLGEMRGFDVFVNDFDESKTYRLARVDFAAAQGVVIAVLQP